MSVYYAVGMIQHKIMKPSVQSSRYWSSISSRYKVKYSLVKGRNRNLVYATALRLLKVLSALSDRKHVVTQFVRACACM